MKKPDLNHLLSYKEVYESSSFAVAAHKLGLTQSALSMQLKKLEEQFALPLFKLVGKKKIPTDFGASVYVEACKLISLYQNSFQDIERKSQSEQKQILRIGCRRELISPALNVLKFKGQIEFFTMSSQESVEKLKENKIDIAISRNRPVSSEIISKNFVTNSWWIVVHKKYTKDFPLKNLESHPTFLTETPFLNYSERFDLVKNHLDGLNIQTSQLQTKYTCEDWLLILKLVEEGHGYSIIPDSLKSTSEDILHIPVNTKADEVIKYYFLYQRSLLKYPAYKDLFKKF